MANIKPYEAPQGIGLSPTEIGIETVAGNARRLGAYGNQIADAKAQEGHELATTVTDVGSVVENYMTHRDISKGAADGAQFVSHMNDLWNQQAASADPNDATIKQKFMQDQLEPELEKFKGNFSTERSQQWAEHFVDQYRQHMSDKTDADMSTLAGIAVRKNVATTVNSLSSAVASDPSSLDFALSSVDHSIGATIASSPNMSATDRAAVTAEVGLKAKESIVKSAISGMITKNPNIDLDAIQKKYGDYINGAEMKMFQKAAQGQAKVDFLQNKAIEAYQDKQKERAAAADLSKTFSDNVQFGADGKVTINPAFYDGVMQTVRKYPGSADDTARTLIQFGQHEATAKRETIVTDPSAQSDLLGRMSDPKNPTTETQILQKANEDKLDPHTTSNLLALRKSLDEAPIKDPVFSSTFSAAKAIIEQSFDGPENFGKFSFGFMREYQRLSRAGELKPDDLDMTKPDSLISKMMAPYKPTPAQIMNYHIMKNIGTDPTNIQTFNNPGGGGPSSGNKPPPVVTTQAQFDSLPSGATYQNNGKTYRKP